MKFLEFLGIKASGFEGRSRNHSLGIKVQEFRVYLENLEPLSLEITNLKS
jgi:hypothetical protein